MSVRENPGKSAGASDSGGRVFRSWNDRLWQPIETWHNGRGAARPTGRGDFCSGLGVLLKELVPDKNHVSTRTGLWLWLWSGIQGHLSGTTLKTTVCSTAYLIAETTAETTAWSTAEVSWSAVDVFWKLLSTVMMNEDIGILAVKREA